MTWSFSLSPWQQSLLMRRLASRLEAHIGHGHMFKPDAHMPMFMLSLNELEQGGVRLSGHPAVRFTNRLHHQLTSEAGEMALSATTVVDSGGSIGAVKTVTKSQIYVKLGGAITAIRQSYGSASLRLLIVPACYVMAIWFQPKAGEDIVHLVDLPRGFSLKAGSNYTGEDFLRALFQYCRAQKLLDAASADAL